MIIQKSISLAHNKIPVRAMKRGIFCFIFPMSHVLKCSVDQAPFVCDS